MTRTALWTLRQRRYRAMIALMLLIAIGCAVAGTWQVARYHRTRRINHVLRANAHTPAVDLTTALVPLVGHGTAPDREAIEFRTVIVRGRYLPGPAQFLLNQSGGGKTGFYVVNALQTSSGTVLVARGFVTATDDALPPATVAAPPSGPVRVLARLRTADTRSDDAARLDDGQLESINPVQQAARRATPTYDAYVELKAHQPGTAHLRAVPSPSLSNPAGGAGEGQHLAYIIQWYAFALLALGAPFAIARNELRDAQRRYLGVDPDAGDWDAMPALGLTSGANPAARALEAGPAAPARELAARPGGGALAGRDGISEQQWQRAADLAARYGRAVSIDRAGVANRTSRRPRRQRAETDGAPRSSDYAYQLPDSTENPHRSQDAYHGSYNDYLWRLAMADGSLVVDPPAEQPVPAAPAPRVIDLAPDPADDHPRP